MARSFNLITSTDTRLKWPNLAKPTAPSSGGEKKYNVKLIFPQTSECIQDISKVITKTYEANLDKFIDEQGNTIPLAELNTPLFLGAREYPNQKEFNGCYFLKAYNRQRPLLYDKARAEEAPSDPEYSKADPSEFHDGAYVSASLIFFAYAYGASRGIGCILDALMKIKDGDSFAASHTTANDFLASINAEKGSSGSISPDSGEDDANNWRDLI